MTEKEIAIINYNEWIRSPYFDDETKAELLAIKDDEGEITERFYMDLKFGTAGLRGVIGAGTNRMNKYTVRKATQGLANYINKEAAAADSEAAAADSEAAAADSEAAAKKGVLIGYDSRNFSPEFAMETALCLAANGIKAYLFDDLRPTPEISYALRYLGCTAGVNITASHNPAKYNGYKAYWADGAQITPPYDTGIMEEVARITNYADCKTMTEDEAKAKGLLEIVGSEIDDAYISELKALVKEPEIVREMGDKLKIVYTPLHGAGNKLVRRVLDEIGFQKVYVVKEQEMPDGDFPTVPYPNPETEKAFELGLKLAHEVDADIILATDPDSDRLGVYIKDTEGGYHSLTGNESGAFIADYELSRLKAHGSLPADGRLISTVVSGKMGRAIAENYGAKYVEVLTGFKYIGEQMKLMEESGDGTYLFGYEESYGCLVGTHARDKDAVVASMALAEAAAYFMSKGINMWDAVIDMFERYGYYKEGVTSLEFEGIEGAEKMRNIMETLRADMPSSIGEFEVIAKRDYGLSKRFELMRAVESNALSKEEPNGLPKEEPIDLPKSEVIYYELPDDAWCCVRPSGTEPKIKLYYGVKGASLDDAVKIENRLKEAMTAYVGV